MLRNYVTVALRYLLKHKGYAGINIIGLSLGIACALLIMLYVQDELSYDRHHEKADRIYRLVAEARSNGSETNRYPSVGGGWTEALKRDFPAVEQVTRFITPFGNQVWVEHNDQRFPEEDFYWADSTFFEVFTYRFLAGDPATALEAPYSVVLTESAAQKYFGRTDVVGQALGVEVPGPDGAQIVDHRVTAVIADPPVNAHFHFTILGTLSTLRVQFGEQANQFLENFAFTLFYTYFVVQEGYDIEALRAQLPAFFTKYTSEQDRSFLVGLHLQALTDVHLHSNLLNEIEPNSDISYIYIFTAIAVLTLLIACINFMNLATARSANRAREVGLRKVVGAERSHLVRQFLGESLMMALLSLAVAMVLAELLLPVFNALSGKEMTIRYLENPLVVLGLLVLGLTVGLLAGSYPALYLSSFQPIAVLKGTLQAGARSGVLRRVLVVSQFAVTIVFLVGTGVILSQLHYIRNVPLGFEREDRVVIPVQIADQEERIRTVDLLERAFAQHPGVVSTTATSNVPGQLRNITRMRLPGMTEEDAEQVTVVAIDHDYVRTMGIELVGGRNFNEQMSTDSTAAFLVNEATLDVLGLSDGVDARVLWDNNVGGGGPNAEQIDGTIIGVYRDMHFEPLYRRINPMVFRIDPPNYFTLIVELNPDQVPATLAAMEQTWNERVPDRAFQYSFLAGDLDEVYAAEQKLSDVVGYFTLFAIFIACLGLFGLASFTAEQRTKEIGVRKVLGASVPGIIVMLNREFTKLILIAFVVAVPLGYVAMDRWLETFTYHTTINPLIFVGAGTAALLIAWLTVGYQSIRAATSNPVNALRYD